MSRGQFPIPASPRGPPFIPIPVSPNDDSAESGSIFDKNIKMILVNRDYGKVSLADTRQRLRTRRSGDDGFELYSFRVVVGAIRWSLARLMIVSSIDCSEVNPSDFRGQMTHSLGIVLILADLSLPLGVFVLILEI